MEGQRRFGKNMTRCGQTRIIVRSCVCTLVRSRRTQWPWPEWPPRSVSGLLLLLLEDGEDPGFTDLFGEPLSGKVDCRSAAVFEI